MGGAHKHERRLSNSREGGRRAQAVKKRADRSKRSINPYVLKCAHELNRAGLVKSVENFARKVQGVIEAESGAKLVQLTLIGDPKTRELVLDVLNRSERHHWWVEALVEEYEDWKKTNS